VVKNKQGSLHGKVREKVQKRREMRNAHLSLLWYSVARGRQQENSHRQVGSARASPLAFSPVAGQPRHFSDFPKNGEKYEMAFFVDELTLVDDVEVSNLLTESMEILLSGPPDSSTHLHLISLGGVARDVFLTRIT